MKEKELRIALVCSGGISLSIYMHGISKEILTLVRASKSLHSIVDRHARSAASFFDYADVTDPEYDTDATYFELLQHLGTDLELRVVVDVIAGASAGGINGTMLARALSHDLPMGALRELWLDHADVDDLLGPEAKAEAWSKWFLKPLFWVLGGRRTMAGDQGPGGAPEIVAFYSLAMVRGTAERFAHGGAYVQCHQGDGQSAKSTGVAAAPGTRP
jgi:patatin-related protein